MLDYVKSKNLFTMFNLFFNKEKNLGSGFKLKFSKPENSWIVTKGHSIMYIGGQDQCKTYMSNFA